MLIPPLPAKALMNTAVEFLDIRMGELQFFSTKSWEIRFFVRSFPCVVLRPAPISRWAEHRTHLQNRNGLILKQVYSRTSEMNYSLLKPMRLKVHASLGRTTGSRCSPGYRAVKARGTRRNQYRVGIPTMRRWKWFQRIFWKRLNVCRAARTIWLEVTESSEKLEEGKTKMAKKHAAAARSSDTILSRATTREDWQICPRSCVRSHVSCQSTDGQALHMIFERNFRSRNDSFSPHWIEVRESPKPWSSFWINTDTHLRVWKQYRNVLQRTRKHRLNSRQIPRDRNQVLRRTYRVRRIWRVWRKVFFRTLGVSTAIR